MKKEKLVVIDGHAVIHRAYHAMPPLTTKTGESVNAVYGFASILLNVIRDLKPSCIAVAFDLPGKTKRHEEYELYKANRKAAPDDLKQQIMRVREVVEAFSIPVYDLLGYEADDVIGAIAKTAPKNTEIYIVTGDMDELQLVDARTKVYTMRRGFTDTVIYDIEAVRARYDGLLPSQLVDYKALKGDPSDNIPGVSGIGEKTAINLIKEYGSLENLYNNLDKLNPKLAEKLEKEREIAFLSKKLSTIETDIKFGFDLSKCYVHDYDKTKVFELFQGLGFKSLLPRLPKEKEGAENVRPKTHKHIKETNYHKVIKEEDLDKLVKLLSKQKVFAFDTETDALDEINANLVGLSFSFKEGEAYYIPVGHNGCPQLPLDLVLEKLKPVLEDKKISKVGHNIKYDLVVLKRYGIDLGPICFDTMVAGYLLNPNARAQKLDDLAFSELGLEMIKITEVIGEKKNQISFADGEIDECKTYACEDADVTFRLYEHLLPQLKKADLLNLLEKIEMPLIPVLGEMELTGIAVNKNSLEKTSKEFAKRIAVLEKSIWKKAGKEFNIASPGQLQEILFDKLKLDEKIEDKRELKKLKTGGYSTAAQELEKLRGVHPIVEEVFEYRELTKLKNTYVDVLPTLINPKTGRIHTSFNQAITQTGRLSSSDPNLQNIPIRTETGKKIRETFIPDPGYVLLSCDYSQIELRVVAHIAKDKEMIEIFKKGHDIHAETAAKVYSVKEKDVTSQMRRIAKIINFGILYGVSAHGLHQQTGMSREEGKSLIDKYFEIHPMIKKYTEEVVSQAKEMGYVETIFGRKRYLPEIKSTNFAVRGAAERMAINMPVQGTAADLMKLAMIDVSKGLSDVCANAKLLLQVHDELVLEVPEKDIKKVAKFVKEKMDKVVSLSVPIETSVCWGKNWGEAKE